MKISVILLAAGSSKRFAGNKLLYPINGKPMYRHLLDIIPEIGFSFHTQILVTQHREIEESVHTEYPGWNVIQNTSPELGITHSLQLGLQASKDSDAWLFMVCDQPWLESETVRKLLKTYQTSGKGIACVCLKGEPGNPVLFDKKYHRELMELTGDRGGKQIVRRYPEDCVYVEASRKQELTDVDTPWELPLFERLRLRCNQDRVISLVGGGGKTTTLYTLAQELIQRGSTVLVTTTTHIRHPDNHYIQLETPEDLTTIRQALTKERWAIIGRITTEGKIQSPPESLYPQIRRLSDYLLVEADGAKGHPLKAPAPHEPVLFPKSDAVIAVIGLDSLNQPIKKVCHRPERVAALLNTTPDHLITLKDLKFLAESPQGLKKNITQEQYRVLLNKADLLPPEQLASLCQTLHIPHPPLTIVSPQTPDSTPYVLNTYHPTP